MEIINNIFMTISIATAIITALMVYRIARESNIRPAITVVYCVLAALIGGAMWLPATVVMTFVFMKECKSITQ